MPQGALYIKVRPHIASVDFFDESNIIPELLSGEETYPLSHTEYIFIFVFVFHPLFSFFPGSMSRMNDSLIRFSFHKGKKRQIVFLF